MPLPTRTSGTPQWSLGPIVVSGAVVGPEGAPVAGAVVEWRAALDKNAPGATATTTSDGSYELTAPSMGIVQLRGGGEPPSIATFRSETGLDFQQTVRCPATLHVQRPDGSPVSGYELTLSVGIGKNVGLLKSALGDHRTDVRGQVPLPDLACGLVTATRADPAQPPLRYAKLDPSLDQDLVLEVVDGVALHGQVEEASGSPAAGLELHISSSTDHGTTSVSVQTDATGTYDVLLTPDSDVNLMVGAQAHGTQLRKLRSPPLDTQDWSDLWVLDARRQLEVRCMDSDGAQVPCGVANGPLSCGGKGAGLGAMCLPDFATGAKLCACPMKGAVLRFSDAPRELVPDGVVVFDWSPAPPRVPGPGEVMARLHLEVDGEPEAGCIVEWTSEGGAGKSSCSGSDVVELVLPTDTPVNIKIYYGELSVSRTVTARENSPDLGSIPVKGDRSVNFLLIDNETDEEARGGRLYLSGKRGKAEGALVTQRAGPESVVRLEGLLPGDWELTAFADGGLFALGMFHLEGAQHQDLELRLNRRP